VQEVARYLAEQRVNERRPALDDIWSREEIGIPATVRDAIGSRLAGLSLDCRNLLPLGAVIGREFRLDTLRQIAGLDEERVVNALEEATRAGVLEEQVQVGAIGYRFPHALFRQTLYEQLSTPRRVRLHDQVGSLLELEYSDHLSGHAAEIAEHFARTTNPQSLRRAIRYGRLAAEHASSLFAYGEAVRLLQQSLDVQQALDPDDAATRCDLLLGLGTALMPAGEPRRVTETIAAEALALAEARGDTARAARACDMALVGLRIFGGPAIWNSPEWSLWATRADRYAAPETPERAHADLAIGAFEYARGNVARCWEINNRALSLARHLNDAELVFRALATFCAPSWPPAYENPRRRIADEYSAWPRDGVSPVSLGQVLIQYCWTYLGWGDRPRSEELSRQFVELAERTQDSHLLLRAIELDISFATVDGRLEDAIGAGDRLVARGGELGRLAYGSSRAAALTAPALFYIGRAEEVLAGMRQVAPNSQQEEAPLRDRVRVPLCLAHLGRLPEAREALEQVMSESRVRASENGTITSVLAVMLKTALLVEDLEAVALLASRLAGLASMPAFITVHESTCIARLLGGASALAGDLTAARGYYEQALEGAALVGFRPELALTRLELAELLLREPQTTARATALAHLEVAVNELRAMTMAPALDRALALGKLHGPTVAHSTQASRPAGPDRAGVGSTLSPRPGPQQPADRTSVGAKRADRRAAHQQHLRQARRADAGSSHRVRAYSRYRDPSRKTYYVVSATGGG
jgi:tetratricopeptide (TPR) repeat protein